MLAYPKSSWGDLAPGLARRETVSSVEEVEKSRRRAGPWRQTKGTTKPLGGRRPRPPESITTGPSVQAPPSARAGQPYGRCFQVPQDAWSRRPRRPNATESRRIGRSAHQFFFFAGLALSIGHIGRALGPPKTKVTMPFAIPTAEMPGRRHAEPWGPFVCQQRRKEKKRSGDGILVLALLVDRPSPLSRVNTGILIKSCRLSVKT